MRVVLQRVTTAEVRIDDGVSGRIGRGFVVLAGFGRNDDETTLAWMADKIVGLRLFADGDGRMNLDLDSVGGEILVVSQFTLYGDARKGRRPSFVAAADPAVAVPLYDRFLELLEDRVPGRVQCGEFGAMMDVELVNDGPVTLILER